MNNLTQQCVPWFSPYVQQGRRLESDDVMNISDIRGVLVDMDDTLRFPSRFPIMPCDVATSCCLSLYFFTSR